MESDYTWAADSTAASFANYFEKKNTQQQQLHTKCLKIAQQYNLIYTYSTKCCIKTTATQDLISICG